MINLFFPQEKVGSDQQRLGVPAYYAVQAESLEFLTSGFEMSPGVAPPLWSPVGLFRSDGYKKVFIVHIVIIQKISRRSDKMLILAVSIICGAMLGLVAYLTRRDLPEAIAVGFLLFVVLDTLQRSILKRKFPIKLWKEKSIEELQKEVKAKG